MLYFYLTVEGSLSENPSRHMLQESSQDSCIPPSTKAAADDIWFSAFFVSSILGALNNNTTQNQLVYVHICYSSYYQGKNAYLYCLGQKITIPRTAYGTNYKKHTNVGYISLQLDKQKQETRKLKVSNIGFYQK